MDSDYWLTYNLKEKEEREEKEREMESSSMVCYVRRAGRPWEPAPFSYQRLLIVYEELTSAQRLPLTVCTSTEDGSVLMAYLQPKPHMAGVYLCRLEEGDTVELMRGPRALCRKEAAP